jgi:hypothetical protein
MQKWDNFREFRFAKIFVLRENFRFQENFCEHLCINFSFRKIVSKISAKKLWKSLVKIWLCQKVKFLHKCS